MLGFIKRLIARLNPWHKGYRVAEIRYVSYRTAEELCRQGWELHTEREDHNEVIGMVWMERREPLKA